MRSLILFTALLILSTFKVNSQKVSDIFESSDYDFVYYGIDFSNAKFIGDFSQFGDGGTKSMGAIKSEYFGSWNGVVENEKDKYDIGGALRIENLQYKTAIADKANSRTDIKKMEADYCDELTKKDLDEIIKSYDIPDESGIGIMFIVEYFNKNKANAGLHFVIFNISSQEILINKRYVEDAGGFGLRNYWARPFYDLIQSAAKDYKKWKREYPN